MASCDLRQLTEAQRQAGYDQQRTGVMRAIRPFSGPATIENLIDYVNRELGPAVRSSRDKVNEVFKQVADNAPSANPLAYYFSTTTTNADPTTGRMRLNQAVQNTATVVRVSQTNGRQQDVTPWLDVMSGGPTAPLGVLTMVDAINPGRFLRFDLNTMTDQGAYWDLGVTIVESSTADPFVDDEPVVIGFIAGVSAAGSTIPVGALSPIARDTFVGNIGTTTAPPAAVPFASIDSTSIVYDATAHEMQRAALTGEVTAAQNVNALVVTRSTNFQTSPWTGNHEFDAELRLGTLHTEASASGALNVTLTAGATRLLISSTADVTLGTISGCADGRVLVVEHARTSGVGVVHVTHGTGTNAIACPHDDALFLGQRGNMVLVGRGTNWKVMAATVEHQGEDESATTSGSIDDVARANNARLIMFTPSAALDVGGFAAAQRRTDMLFVQRQGATGTFTLNDNDTGSAAGNRLAHKGDVNLRLGDDECAAYVYGDITSGGTDAPRWICVSHHAPFCNTSANAPSDTLVHDGTDWQVKANGNGGRLLQRSVLTSGSSATFTHHAECKFFIIKGAGGGAAGGGVNNVAGAIGACGGSATYGEKVFTLTAATSTYTVGAAGTGVSGGTGSSGTASSWTHNGVTLGLPPGSGGSFAGGGGTIASALGGAGGGDPTGSAADVQVNGQTGGDACRPSATTGFAMHSGPGGSTPIGNGGAANAATTAQVPGETATGYGAGGSGALEGSSTTAAIAGADGSPGVWIVEQYT